MGAVIKNRRLWELRAHTSLRHLLASGAHRAYTIGILRARAELSLWPASSFEWMRHDVNGPRGVTVSTLDSESSDRGSNPREAFFNKRARASTSQCRPPSPLCGFPPIKVRRKKSGSTMLLFHGSFSGNWSPVTGRHSACSVAASYKPPMLVTRVRLPACACFCFSMA